MYDEQFIQTPHHVRSYEFLALSPQEPSLCALCLGCQRHVAAWCETLCLWCCLQRFCSRGWKIPYSLSMFLTLFVFFKETAIETGTLGSTFADQLLYILMIFGRLSKISNGSWRLRIFFRDCGSSNLDFHDFCWMGNKKTIHWILS